MTKLLFLLNIVSEKPSKSEGRPNKPTKPNLPARPSSANLSNQSSLLSQPFWPNRPGQQINGVSKGNRTKLP